MIDKQLLIDTIQEAIADTDVFLVKVQVKPDNSIIVELDSDTAVDLSTPAPILPAASRKHLTAMSRTTSLRWVRQD